MFYALKIGLTMEDIWWTDYGMLLDLISLYKVHNGIAKLGRYYSDEEVIPDID